jgi:hypothetical protein
MKATLKFNLPEEQEEFNYALNGSDYYSFIWDFKQHLRSQTKHPKDGISEDYVQAMIDVQRAFFAHLDDHKINLQ